MQADADDQTDEQYYNLLKTSVLIIVFSSSLLKTNLTRLIWDNFDMQDDTVAEIWLSKDNEFGRLCRGLWLIKLGCFPMGYISFKRSNYLP